MKALVLEKQEKFLFRIGKALKSSVRMTSKLKFILWVFAVVMFTTTNMGVLVHLSLKNR